MFNEVLCREEATENSSHNKNLSMQAGFQEKETGSQLFSESKHEEEKEFKNGKGKRNHSSHY